MSIKNFTLDDVVKQMEELGKSTNTIRSYKNKWETIIKSFPPNTKLNKGFANDDEIIKIIYSATESPSTRKVYLSAYKNILELYGYPNKKRLRIKELISGEKENNQIQQAIKNQSPPFSLEEAKEMFKQLTEKFKFYMKKAKGERLYGNNTMTAAYLMLILKHGVLRSDELHSIKITDVQHEDFNNISKADGVLTIVDHKNKKSIGTIKTQIDKAIIPLIKKANMDAHFIHTASSTGNGYASGDGVTKFMKRQVGFNNHLIRDAKTSIVLNSDNKERRDALKKYQMHNLDTQLQHYTKHAKAAEEVYLYDPIKE
jgi:hypothetical protein